MKHRINERNVLDHILDEWFWPIMAALVGLTLGLLIGMAAADSDTSSPAPAPAPKVKTEKWVEPYGGCDEAYLYPKSRGYAECVAHGFIEEQ